MKDFYFMLTLFAANTMQTITGFAGNLLAMPLSIKLEGYDSARAVINIFTLLACLIITIQNLHCTNFRVLFKMAGIMCIGMTVGTMLLQICRPQILSVLYGIMIISVALKKLLIKKEFKLPKYIMIILLIIAGIIHGLFLSGGALAVIYALSEIKDKNEFRATIAPLWVILDTILIFFHMHENLYVPHNLILIALSIIPMLLSIAVGNVLYKYISREMFLKITYILLILSGITAII